MAVNNTVYVLDSNILIQAKAEYYKFSYCPGFWDLIMDSHYKGKVESIESVRKELLNGNDELAQWIKKVPKPFFIAPDKDTFKNLTSVSQWVDQQKKYKPADVTKFLSGADPILIAHCMNRPDRVLVSQETIVAKESSKVTIPNVAQQFGVSVINTFEFLDRVNYQLVLKK